MRTVRDLSDRYQQDGFYFPIEAMSRQHAACCRDALERAESQFGERTDFKRIMRGYANMVFPFVDEISRSPAALDPVSEILEPRSAYAAVGSIRTRLCAIAPQANG